ncbi:hypothetical protein Bca52824_072992 [Brassica carinata]|uniref:Uncharacterized protein n=1 Tax=Brassica carinata TaxID=52824 RepID=A0A8X7Q9S7_BRACI|nr:hypothetical protein Bca52824_072992 [Brassica carinata]
MDASLGMDDDEFLIRQVEAVEASFGLNSQTAEGVQGSKDKDSGAAVDGVNPASGNMLQQEKQKSCALGTVVEVVENGSKKRAHVEAAEDVVCGVNPDNMHQQNCTLQEKEKSCGEGTVVENGSEKRANVEAEVVVDGLVVMVMSVLWSPKLEVKGLEEANGQGLQVDLRQTNSVAI